MENEARGREPKGLIFHHARCPGLDPASSRRVGFLLFFRNLLHISTFPRSRLAHHNLHCTYPQVRPSLTHQSSHYAYPQVNIVPRGFTEFPLCVPTYAWFPEGSLHVPTSEFAQGSLRVPTTAVFPKECSQVHNSRYIPGAQYTPVGV
jgi:hypothetical protein